MATYKSRDILEFGGFVIAGFFVRLLPFRVAQRVGRRLGEFLYTNIKIRREVTYRNLREAFPDKSIEEIDAIALEAYANMMITFMEMLWTPNLTRGVLLHCVRLRNPEVYEQAARRGKGVIFLGGHFGSWELMAHVMPVLLRTPSLIIAKEQRNPLVDRLLTKYRSVFGNQIVVMEHSVREVLTRLRNNGSVVMLADQSAPKERLFVNFFNRPAATFEGPAVFALRSGAPVLMMFLVRQKNGRYEFILEELPVDDIETATEENILELTRRHVAVLERYVREYPGQWLWLHKRWKHTEFARHRPVAEEESVPGDGPVQ